MIFTRPEIFFHHKLQQSQQSSFSVRIILIFIIAILHTCYDHHVVHSLAISPSYILSSSSLSPTSTLTSVLKSTLSPHHRYHNQDHYHSNNKYQKREIISTQLNALKKTQTAIYDGAEFISITSFLLTESNPRLVLEESQNGTDDICKIQNIIPTEKAGYLTWVVGTDPVTNARILAIQASSSTATATETNNELTLIDKSKNTWVYTDSIATIPKSVNDNDAISTASAALCGAHCGIANNVNVERGDGKVVILGGGDYACFIAKAMAALGVQVNLVTTRPMSLKDTPLNPLRDADVNAMPPNIKDEDTKSDSDDDDDIGFSEALGEFDAIVDTLGDEANLRKVKSLQDGINRFCGDVGVVAKLAKANNCRRYVSTVTRSQQLVLEEGIFFARSPVLNYQKKVEQNKKIKDSSSAGSSNDGYFTLVPPRNYGKTIQSLFDKNVIYPTDRNENGSHGRKNIFVRGCSFPDYAEIEIWPRDTTDGAAVRFGFPGIQELTLEARMDKVIGTFDSASNQSANQSATKNGEGSVSSSSETSVQEGDDSNKKTQSNPFMLEVESLADITQEIRNTKKDAVLFVSAPYCRLCRSIGPLYNRMARISREELNSDLQFAKVTTGSSKASKQLQFTLQVESVPTFILFRKGERYGENLGVSKLPSVKLNRAIEYLKTGKDWDSEIGSIDEGRNKMRTKLQ